MAFVKVIFFTCVISCALQFSFSAPSLTTEAVTEINKSVTDTSKKLVGTVSEGVNKKLNVEGAAIQGLAGILTTSTNNILGEADKGIKTATDLGKNSVQVPSTILGDSLFGLGSTFQSTGKLALGLGENVKSGIDKSTNFSAQKKSESKDSITSKLEAAVDKSSHLVSQVKSDVKETAQSVTSKVEEVVDKTNNLAAQATKEVKDAAQTATSKVEELVDNTNNLAAQATKEVKDAAHTATSKVEEVVDKTNNVAAQATKEVKDAAETATSKVEETLDKASSTISLKETEIKEGVKTAVSNVETNLEKASSENTVSQVKSLATEGSVTTAVKTA
ncbi:uncharacterized protein LOC142319281 [Lycorma delicatula]|uniref:uncharacterized protein LOC142319281 n=1 Tax=Lycorma delicatula TaxID=130591 RepID=UPI003F515DED